MKQVIKVLSYIVVIPLSLVGAVLLFIIGSIVAQTALFLPALVIGGIIVTVGVQTIKSRIGRKKWQTEQ